MVSEAMSLAVRARTMQWQLDEAAFELGGGRFSQEQCDKLAGDLVKLAELLRSGCGVPLVVDAPDD